MTLFDDLCHYCSELATDTVRHYASNGPLRSILRLPMRQYVRRVCVLHRPDPAAYNPPEARGRVRMTVDDPDVARAARREAIRRARESDPDGTLEAARESIRRRRDGLR